MDAFLTIEEYRRRNHGLCASSSFCKLPASGIKTSFFAAGLIAGFTFLATPFKDIYNYVFYLKYA